MPKHSSFLFSALVGLCFSPEPKHILKILYEFIVQVCVNCENFYKSFAFCGQNNPTKNMNIFYVNRVEHSDNIIRRFVFGLDICVYQQRYLTSHIYEFSLFFKYYTYQNPSFLENNPNDVTIFFVLSICNQIDFTIFVKYTGIRIIEIQGKDLFCE